MTITLQATEFLLAGAYIKIRIMPHNDIKMELSN